MYRDCVTPIAAEAIDRPAVKLTMMPIETCSFTGSVFGASHQILLPLQASVSVSVGSAARRVAIDRPASARSVAAVAFIAGIVTPPRAAAPLNCPHYRQHTEAECEQKAPEFSEAIAQVEAV